MLPEPLQTLRDDPVPCPQLNSAYLSGGDPRVPVPRPWKQARRWFRGIEPDSSAFVRVEKALALSGF